MVSSLQAKRKAAWTLVRLIGALAIFVLAALGTARILQDATPLLTTPRPDLRFPLGATGIVAGWLGARWMADLPHIRDQKRRWVFFILLPVMLSFSFAGAGELLSELKSFRNQSQRARPATARVIEKTHQAGRRGHDDSYAARVSSPFGGRQVSIDVDRSLHERIDPLQDCLNLLVQEAPDGAVRMIAVTGVIKSSKTCGQ